MTIREHTRRYPQFRPRCLVVGGCAVETQEATPQFLLIVRERLRPGSDEPYDKNELQLAAVCATLKCPHPYLALASVAGPKEVWWFNAFTSREERDGLEPAYARNEPLMAAMRPLGKRKEDFREAFTSTMREYRRDLSGGALLRITGARFFIISTSQDGGGSAGAVFASSDGELFVIASANDRAAADDIAARSRPEAMILAVQPQWSFPAKAWIDADPEFWNGNLAARKRECSLKILCETVLLGTAVQQNVAADSRARWGNPKSQRFTRAGLRLNVTRPRRRNSSSRSSNRAIKIPWLAR